MSKENNKNFPFTYEGKKFDSPKEKVTTKDIIKIVEDNDAKNINPIGNLMLKPKDKENIYSKDQTIDLLQENNFVSSYKFQVNGQELESSIEKLIVTDIIQMAQKKGAIPPEERPENWDLQVSNENLTFEKDKWVDLTRYDNFILIQNTSTTVA